MIARALLLGLPLALIACGASSAKVGGSDDSGAADGIDIGDDGDDGDDGSDGSDAGDDGGEPTTADWAGDWTASVDLTAYAFDYVIPCPGEFTVNFDEDGEGEGEGACAAEGVGEIPLGYELSVDDAGEVEGTLTIELYGFGIDVDVNGSATSDDAIPCDAEGSIEVAGYRADVEGSMDLSR